MTKPRRAPPATDTRRCAIYTRKSTSAGLEQDFNSLDSQYESCLAYIQRTPGWKLVRERYDDGGFTGANTDRPAFQRLMADVDAGKIDVIVVYKVAQLLALAHHLREAIESGRLPDGASVARTLGFTRARISQILGLTLLAPDIQEAVLALEAVDGAEPAVNERVLRGVVHAASWREQRERFGEGVRR
jgi:hypothetical protein